MRVSESHSYTSLFLLIALLDDVRSGVRVESLSGGYKLNCTVLYHGPHEPNIHFITAENTTIQAASSSRVQTTSHGVVSSEVFVSEKEQSSLPSYCQMTVALYRCKELSSVYMKKFPIDWKRAAANGECIFDDFND